MEDTDLNDANFVSIVNYKEEPENQINAFNVTSNKQDCSRTEIRHWCKSKPDLHV